MSKFIFELCDRDNVLFLSAITGFSIFRSDKLKHPKKGTIIHENNLFIYSHDKESLQDIIDNVYEEASNNFMSIMSDYKDRFITKFNLNPITEDLFACEELISQDVWKLDADKIVSNIEKFFPSIDLSKANSKDIHVKALIFWYGFINFNFELDTEGYYTLNKTSFINDLNNLKEIMKCIKKYMLTDPDLIELNVQEKTIKFSRDIFKDMDSYLD